MEEKILKSSNSLNLRFESDKYFRKIKELKEREKKK